MASIYARSCGGHLNEATARARVQRECALTLVHQLLVIVGDGGRQHTHSLVYALQQPENVPRACASAFSIADVSARAHVALRRCRASANVVFVVALLAALHAYAPRAKSCWKTFCRTIKKKIGRHRYETRKSPTNTNRQIIAADSHQTKKKMRRRSLRAKLFIIGSRNFTLPPLGERLATPSENKLTSKMFALSISFIIDDF